MTDSDMTADEILALKIAHEFVDAGVPIFVASQCPPDCPIPQHRGGPGEYHLPSRWQALTPSHERLERWRPGMALGAVGGWTADFLDIDPRNGGLESEKELKHPAINQFPRSFGQQITPSGGSHHVISKTGERKCTMFMPGLDLQSGGPIDHNGTAGRGFVYIAPTVRPSKAADTLGQLRAYRWVVKPDLAALAEYAGQDKSITGIVTRVKAKRTPVATPARDAFSPFGQEGRPGGGPRAFTLSQAQDFVRPFLIRVQQAQIGEIEERCNDAAAVLSHFVPSHWNVDAGMDLLIRALGHTAYDPAGPGNWTVDKFRPVLDGTRPVIDAWPATLVPDVLSVPEVTVDAVDALLAEMLTPAEIGQRPPPRPLVRKLLNFDSESWIIGEPGSKKSFVAQDIAGHVATGRPWQGLKVTQAPVVMIVAEGAGGMSSRMRAWETEYGPMPDTVRILPRPVQAKDAGAWAVLVQACARLAPGLVVLDTQARITVGLEENSATEMGIYVEAVRAIREATGACVLTVHHTGRKGGDARGSSAIDGAQHTELKVESKGLRGTLSIEKQKDMESIPDLPLCFKVIDLGQDADGEVLTSLVLASDPFDVADGEMPDSGDHGRAVHVRDPQAWTFTLFGHVKQGAKRQILQTLLDVAGETGRTESQIKAVVRERWYLGQKGRAAGSLSEATWGRSWTDVTAVMSGGEPVVVKSSGERWILNQTFSAGLDDSSDLI